MTRLIQRIRLPIRGSAEAVRYRTPIQKANIHFCNSYRAQVLSGRTKAFT